MACSGTGWPPGWLSSTWAVVWGPRVSDVAYGAGLGRVLGIIGVLLHDCGPRLLSGFRWSERCSSIYSVKPTAHVSSARPTPSAEETSCRCQCPPCWSSSYWSASGRGSSGQATTGHRNGGRRRGAWGIGAKHRGKTTRRGLGTSGSARGRGAAPQAAACGTFAASSSAEKKH